MHALIAWAFMFYFLVNALDVLRGFTGWTVPGAVGNVYRSMADVLSVAALVAMTWFLLRRFVFKTPVLNYRENVKLMPSRSQAGRIRRDSLIVGLFILAHIGFRFLGESFEVAQHSDRLAALCHGGQRPVGRHEPEGALIVAQHACLVDRPGPDPGLHPLLPLHQAHPPDDVGRQLPPATPAHLARRDRAHRHGGRDHRAVRRGPLEQLPWKHMLDAYSCIMCNRCQDVCPAYTTGKELSPSALEVNKRLYINANSTAIANGGATDPLLDYAISESAVWACTACGACIQVCPVGNEPMFDIMYMRRNQMMMENSFPHELQTAYKGMERSGNPWNLARRDRMKWADGLDIPTVEENPDFDVLWWVGCAPSYDMRAQSTARAFAEILKATNTNFAVLGEMENCTGDSARRSGNEALFFELATANIETLNEFVAGEKPKRIVTTCPHCMHTLGKEYHQYGGSYEVIHSTQFMAEMMEQGKLRPMAGAVKGGITLHDPCYLGRMNGVVDAPRQALQGVNGSFVEMPRHGEQSFCCGAGGAQMWKEEEHGTAAVNITRYEEAAALDVKTIAVGCPFCLTMLTDASKQADQGIEVKDIVELVASGLTSVVTKRGRRLRAAGRVGPKQSEAGVCLPRVRLGV